MDHQALLDLLIDRAPKLRAAGVRTCSIDGFTFDLAPHEPAVATSDEDDKPSDLDPLQDPDTYGGRVPGFLRPVPDARDSSEDDPEIAAADARRRARRNR